MLVLQQSFAMGEVAPATRGLADSRFVQFGCQSLRNAILSSFGSARRRSGTRFVIGATGNYAARIFEFRPTCGGDYLVVITSNDSAGHKHLMVLDNSTGDWLDDWADGEAHSPFPVITASPVAAPGGSPPTGVTATNSYLHFWNEGELPTLSSFMYENRLYIITQNRPPVCLEATPPEIGTWGWGIAPVVEVSPVIEQLRPPATITASFDSGTGRFTLTADAPIFSSQDNPSIFRIGQAVNQLSSSTPVKHGLWIYVDEIVSAYQAKGGSFTSRHATTPFQNESTTDWSDWFGPVSQRSTTLGTLSYVSGGGGGSAISNDIADPTRVASSTSAFTRDMVGMPIFREGGTFPSECAIMMTYHSATQATLYRAGTTAFALPNTGRACQINTSRWSAIPMPWAIFQGQGVAGTDFLVTYGKLDPAKASSGNPFTVDQGIDRYDSAVVGGTIHAGDGVVSIVADSSSTISLDGTTHSFKTRSSPSFLGPFFKWGVGWCYKTGFPIAGVAHQSRVFFGGFSGDSDSVVGSGIGRPDTYAVRASGSADDPIRIDIAASEGGRIRWIESHNDLLIGTERGEYAVSGTPISAESLAVTPQTSYGAGVVSDGTRGVKPARAVRGVAYVARGGHSLRFAEFSEEHRRYDSIDLAEHASHIFYESDSSEIRRICYSTHPDQLLMAMVHDGTRHHLKALSLRPESEVLGWSPWDIGEADDIEDIVAGGDGYFRVLVKRTVGGSTVRYVEIVDPANVLDCQKTLDSGITADEIGGCEWLAGKAVQVVGDGIYIGEFVVDENGDIDISGIYTEAPSEVVVGLPFTFELVPATQNTRGRDGSFSAGIIRRVARLLLFVRSSKGLIVEGELFHDVPNVPANTEVEALDGWVEVPAIGDGDRDPQIAITQNAPYPFEVIAVNMDVEPTEV